MKKSQRAGVTRRSFLVGTGTLVGTAIALPRISVSADGKTLKIRSYSDIQVMDPALRLSAPEGDIMRAIYAGLVANTPGDSWGRLKGMRFATP